MRLGFECACRFGSVSVLDDTAAVRDSTYFCLLTALNPPGVFIETQWSKRPTALFPPYAQTLVHGLERRRCPQCHVVHWVSAPPPRDVQAAGFYMRYPVQCISEGGLSEAHAHFVDQVRRGVPLGWGEMGDMA